MNLETIIFKNNTLKIIDQQLLPNQLHYVALETIDDVIEAIRCLKVRGAPAIGVVAAYGIYIHADNLYQNDAFTPEALGNSARQLKATRPTAVNLQWAVDRMMYVLNDHADDPHGIVPLLKKTAIGIHEDDKSRCSAIGENGESLIPNGASVLTHCNAGALATGGSGTALSVIYKAVEHGKKVHVYVDETRPVGQGVRLTYFELKHNGVPATLISDNMAGTLMQQKLIDMVLVGADRVALNGDIANKIGTYTLAVLAHYHSIPFYVAAPLSTFDSAIESGRKIPIEEREPDEILKFWNIDSALNYEVYNPAFDITPARLIKGIITEEGITFSSQ